MSETSCPVLSIFEKYVERSSENRSPQIVRSGGHSVSRRCHVYVCRLVSNGSARGRCRGTREGFAERSLGTSVVSSSGSMFSLPICALGSVTEYEVGSGSVT